MENFGDGVTKKRKVGILKGRASFKIHGDFKLKDEYFISGNDVTDCISESKKWNLNHEENMDKK